MNRNILIAFATTLALAVHAKSGGSFAIISSTIDGGGTSRGGQFVLSGTIGQPDAAPPLVSTNGRFQLEPGFWSGVIVLQTPGAPLLNIRLVTAGQAVISWPVGVTGFALEACPDLGSGEWTPVNNSVVDTSTEHTVIVPSVGNQCFRLREGSR